MYSWKSTPEPASDKTGGHSRTVDQLFNDPPPSPETSLEDLSLSSITFDTINETDARDKIFVHLSIKINKHREVFLEAKIDTDAQGNLLPLLIFQQFAFIIRTPPTY